MSRQKKVHPVLKLMNRRSGPLQLRNIYRSYLGTYRGFPIWIVSGERIKMTIYPCFEMGGNPERYKFMPGTDYGVTPEFWIDDRSAIVELPYTIAHECIEYKLMLEKKLSYENAHNQALALEDKMRESDRRICEVHRKRINKQYGINLPPGIYRRFYGIRGKNKMRVYVVDGSLVRNVDTDFSNGAHPCKKNYIPQNEVWIDMNLTVKDHLAVLAEILTEHQYMAKGMTYRKAYEKALCMYYDTQLCSKRRASKHERELPIVSYGDRNYGSKGRAKKK